MDGGSAQDRSRGLAALSLPFFRGPPCGSTTKAVLSLSTPDSLQTTQLQPFVLARVPDQYLHCSGRSSGWGVRCALSLGKKGYR